MTETPRTATGDTEAVYWRLRMNDGYMYPRRFQTREEAEQLGRSFDASFEAVGFNYADKVVGDMQRAVPDEVVKAVREAMRETMDPSIFGNSHDEPAEREYDMAEHVAAAVRAALRKESKPLENTKPPDPSDLYNDMATDRERDAAMAAIEDTERTWTPSSTAVEAVYRQLDGEFPVGMHSIESVREIADDCVLAALPHLRVALRKEWEEERAQQLADEPIYEPEQVEPLALVGEFDATVWARVFVRTVQRNPCVAIDRATMVAWFASAIMAGYDRAETARARDAEALTTATDALKAIAAPEHRMSDDWAAMVATTALKRIGEDT